MEADYPVTGSILHAGSQQLTHLQTVLNLPPGADALAVSDHDRHQIVRYGPRALSTQFHPEFTPDIMRNVITARSDVLRAEGHDPDAALAAVRLAPKAATLMRRFVDHVLAADGDLKPTGSTSP